MTLCLLGLARPLWAAASDTELEKRYLEARNSYDSLLKDPRRSKWREPYLALRGTFEAIETEAGGRALADRAGFMAARSLQALSEASRASRDLDAAIDAMVAFSQRYPESRLADDALMAAAQMASERKKNPVQAQQLLARLLQRYPKGDMAPQAQQLAAQLSPVEEGVSRPAPAAAASTTASASEPPASAEPVAPQPQVEPVDRIDELLRKAELMQARVGDPQPPSTAPASPASAPAVSAAPAPPVRSLPQASEGAPAHLRRLELSTCEGQPCIALDLDAQPGVERGEARADPSKDLPARVYYDLSPARLERGAPRVVAGTGLVTRVRAGQNAADTVRIVIETPDGTQVDLPRPCPLGLCIQLGAAPAVVAEAAPPSSQPQPEPVTPARADPSLLPTQPSAAGLSLSQQVGLKVQTVVIDPGHGGKDPGALGPTGLREKDVMLKLARKVARRLREEKGLNVILTRDDDSFVSLEKRAEIANDAHADLFISLHANASPSRSAYGIETFYLNTTDDRYAIRLAARENAGSEKSIGDLQFILADLVTKSNVDDSRRLGRSIQRTMVARLKKNYSNIKDLGVKHALFYVLIGVRMPAILVETSFISNRREEQRMRSNGYLDAITDGILLGVAEFMASQRSVGS